MRILLSWLVLSFAVWLTSAVLRGFVVRGVKGAIVVAAIFGCLNWLLGWILFVLIGIGTLGLGFLLAFLTRWVVNAVLLLVTDSLSENVAIDGLRTALVAGMLMSLFGTLGEWLVRIIL